jgi:hypothetical protein
MQRVDGLHGAGSSGIQVAPTARRFYGCLSDRTPMDAPLPIRSGCDAASGPPMNSVRKRNGFTIVRIILGVLLLVAAGLKIADSGLETPGGFELFASPWWRLTVIVTETLLGVWLLLGLAPRILWLVTLLFFSVLANMSLYMGIRGRPLCGCFGTILPIQPWYTAALDMCAVAAALIWRPLPHAYTALCCRYHGIVKPIVGTVVLLNIIGGIAGVLAPIASLSVADEVIIEDDKVVVLQPETWVGKRLPLLPYIETPENLSTGEWLLLLVHSDCPKCREVLSRFDQMAKDRQCPDISARVMVIDLVPFNISNLFSIAQPVTSCQRGRLTQQKEWFAKTPVLIKIIDGMVVEVNTAVGL